MLRKKLAVHNGCRPRFMRDSVGSGLSWVSIHFAKTGFKICPFKLSFLQRGLNCVEFLVESVILTLYEIYKTFLKIALGLVKLLGCSVAPVTNSSL